MKKEELIKKLRQVGSSEHDLSELGVEYIIHHCSEEAEVSGYAVVKVEEGALLIPYHEVLPYDGYEQLVIDEARLIDGETLSLILDELQGRLDAFKKMFMQ